VSRTTRVGPVDGFWTTVDAWAADVVEPNVLAAWWRSRCHTPVEAGPYLDVTGDLDGARLPARPLREAIAARGVPYADDRAVREALVDREIDFRHVTRATRFRWTGPAMTPVVLEAHTTPDEGIVEAWWEDIWSAWPRPDLGRESKPNRPPRRATAIAQITRLFTELGHAPLQRPE
jgi:hypothetical protein